MAQPRAVSDCWFYPGALIAAALSAVLVPVAAVSVPVRDALAASMITINCAVTALIFVLMLFNPRVRHGIDAANLAQREGRPFPSFRRVRFGDPQWGLFGTRYGSPVLATIRTALYFEFCPLIFLMGWFGEQTLLLAASGVALTILLSLYHVGLSTPLGGDATGR